MAYLSPTILVAGLAYKTTSETIASFFGKIGPVDEVSLMLNSLGKSKGFAFVTFTKPQDADYAVSNFNGQILDGRRIRVEISSRRKKFKLERKFEMDEYHQNERRLEGSRDRSSDRNTDDSRAERDEFRKKNKKDEKYDKKHDKKHDKKSANAKSSSKKKNRDYSDSSDYYYSDYYSDYSYSDYYYSDSGYSSYYSSYSDYSS
ncbi:hypothetical protein TVAG_345400 [Trichomonas vaginalis G3]|uniref:RRM domain-containing protein n=1 Tax=Trichomonas vaginalis (strain ATCC PRA-98 / G3) TaxID=412133 RepID=A2EW18_TRIV3|nr:glycine-rich RNA-binding protein family [Trichomonas vaginalis G3]EAY03166.1 hypothetical protein TVAG_345400 [Trichomonas vaginalis G3]KAI5545452.1 glycine-rich RNA-binding protein family [Trichomonas vaginalis G3]|eukprot:XP_001315389.1 hypothetical protein [Trichomonas vaginalis G3]